MPYIFPFEPVTAAKPKQGRTTRVSHEEVGHHNAEADKEADDHESLVTADSGSEGMIQSTSSVNQQDNVKMRSCSQQREKLQKRMKKSED